jgi:NADPH:quinone reductase-like Zn-dependent oxidoreductase
MKAAIINSPDGTPAYGDFPEPILTEGREIATMVAAGIHPVVRTLASGEHYASKGAWPMIPGVDAVVRTEDGSLIYTGFIEPPYGTLAQRMAAPSAIRFALPPGADPVQVAGGMNPGMSSWLPLTVRKRELEKLGTVLILGVTGMAGHLAIQNAFALGAERVIGAGRSAAGLQQAAAKHAQTVALTGELHTDGLAIAKALGNNAPSLVLDFVWGKPAEAAFAALGSAEFQNEDEADIAHVQIGSLAGGEASLPASLLRSRRIRISGSGLGSGSLAEIMAQVPVYMKLIADGRVEVPTRVFPLLKIAEAWATNESGRRSVVVSE